MMIIVYFKSGFRQIFIVPENILATEFQHIAEEIGGCIRRIEFTQFSSTQAILNQNQH